MKISRKWLKEYVNPRRTPEKIAETLTLAGFAVEAVEEIAGDVCFTIDVTSNRPDALSMLGIARELAVLTGGKLKIPKVAIAPSNEWARAHLALEVTDKRLCPRYIGRVITDVTIAPSPAWLQERLESVGVRPVNNVVDVTNYVMLECGQPLHAFDRRLIGGGKIVVRPAKAGEKIVAIDGKEYALTDDMLVIADAERPVAVAGVMGGKESEISPSTRTIILESASFDPASVRSTSRRLRLSSESSYRFERGTSWEGVEWASRRAAQLIAELSGGKVADGSLEVRARPPRPVKIFVRPSRVAAVLGVAIPPATIAKLLAAGGFAVTKRKDRFDLVVPPWRRDIAAEIDVIEEIARWHGYHRIPSDLSIPVSPCTLGKEDRVGRMVKGLMTGLDFTEVLTSSFADERDILNFSLWSDEGILELRDPTGRVDRRLRGSLASSLCNILRINAGYKERMEGLFEIASVYHREGGKPGEKMCLGLLSTGGLAVVKGAAERLLAAAGLEASADIVRGEHRALRSGRSLAIVAEGATIGRLGEIDDATRSFYDLPSGVAVAEIDFTALCERATLERTYAAFSRFPPVQRDLAVVVENATEWKTIADCVKSVAPDFLERVEFFDQFSGGAIPAGKKSVAFSLLFRSPDRTLAKAEVDEAMKAVVGALRGTLGGELRQ